MKIVNRIFALLLLTLACGACSYLDVVPDGYTTEKDVSADKYKLRDYLYSCYAYLPQSNAASGSLDMMTGDEVVTAFEHEPFASFPKGNYSAANTVISYWDTFFKGIRQCYMLKAELEKTTLLDEDVRVDYIAQVKFLIAYYHYQLARCYGPIIIIREVIEPDTPVEDYIGREPYDQCVQWICDLLDEAAKDLPGRRSIKSQYGLATSVAAKAVKAKMLLYAASPLFNGNSKFYGNFKDKEGVQLMPTTYDPNKWVKAHDAIKEAIDLAKANGHDLYRTDDYKINQSDANQYPAKGPVRLLRCSLIDWVDQNPEVLLADTRDDNGYGVQKKSLPYANNGNSWNGVCPTWAMLNRFYTKNGLPYDEDPAYKDLNKMDLVTVDKNHEDEAAPGQTTIRFNLDREPRYYAWVAFQGGYYEVLNKPDDKAYTKGYLDDRKSVVCNFLIGEDTNCGRGTSKNAERSNNYSPGGFLNKKGVDPNMTVSKGSTPIVQYPWPVIRLADLYLAYAETCVETGDLITAKEYVNYVRTRAGIPTVETSWAMAGVELTQGKLRDIVRQERMVEFYLENQNFWDMRRWLLAEKYFNVKTQGMDIEATDINTFSKVTTIEYERKFQSPMNYLLPIPNADITKNPKLVNNPGY
ncbi:MAG: RagB/SusD family nutrient uptake outer membrane protein [Mediterranea sp.]|jgi:hypothetical protein|nr:RagB/SusD family nutrient uptake outer membrane protein [Mediterranea sp.]